MSVIADAAYDTVAVYETARARGATVVVPPARTANVSGHGPRSPARDRTDHVGEDDRVGRKVISPRLSGRGGGDLAGVGARGMRAGGFPGTPGGLVVSIVKTAGARAPAHHARGRGRRTWRPTERTAGARMVPPGEGNEARGDGRRGVGLSRASWPQVRPCRARGGGRRSIR